MLNVFGVFSWLWEQLAQQYADRILTAWYCHIFPFLFIVLSVLILALLFFLPLCFWYVVLLNVSSHACHFLLRGSSPLSTYFDHTHWTKQKSLSSCMTENRLAVSIQLMEGICQWKDLLILMYSTNDHTCKSFYGVYKHCITISDYCTLKRYVNRLMGLHKQFL